MRVLYLLVLLALLHKSVLVSAQTIRYVKPIASGNGSGDSWTNAAADLSQVLLASNANDQVWIAAGTYYPTRDVLGNATPADGRTRTFAVRSSVQVYGGFTGTEAAVGERVIVKNNWTTILSGDLGLAGYSFDNAYNVVQLSGSSHTLDNVSVRQANVVTSGQYDGAILMLYTFSTSGPATIHRCQISNNLNRGFQLQSSSTASNVAVLKNCDFANNAGAFRSEYAGVSFLDCTFRDNTASIGGGVNMSAGIGEFVNCTFLNNVSTYNVNSSYNYGGGAIYAYGGSIFLTNCLFDGNRSVNTGAVSVYSYRLIATNCTFVNNQSGQTSAILFTSFGEGSVGLPYEVSLRNCIVWNNQNTDAGSGQEVIRCYYIVPVITFSDVQACSSTAGCPANPGNRSVDPQFLDSSTRLHANSSLINAGDPSATPGSLFSYDMAGLPRISGRIVDMGVYESQQTDEITSVTAGKWHEPDTWSCGCMPTIHDVVRLQHDVQIFPGDVATARSIRYSPSGRLYPMPGSQLRLAPRIWYVKPAASGTGNGTSWANASASLRTILAGAQPSDEVWVAMGIYKPTTGTDRTLSFVIPSGVQMYGGFLGTEAQLSQRRIDRASQTILSGNIGLPDAGDNTYHVVQFQDVAAGTLLDGFTIREGGTQSNTEVPVPPGGYVGAGIYHQSTGAGSFPTIQNCHIVDNRAGSAGGGLYNRGIGTITLRNCLFSTNYGENGGAIYNEHTASTYLSNVTMNVTNCNFLGNSSLQATGGRAIDGGLLSLKNSIVYNNMGNSGAGQIANLSDGSQIGYCIVQDLSSGFAYVGSTVSNQNPLFVTYPAMPNDLRLRSDSPCINTGQPTDTPETVGAFDLAGQPRVFLGRVDMGCFEYISPLY